MADAGATIMEPIMSVEIVVPEEDMGDVMGDLNSRRGRVQGMDAQGSSQLIRAQVPMSEMLTYASTLKSITGGRGNYTMTFSHYDDVPFSRDSLDSNDVFVVAALMGEEAMMIYTWVGKDARPMEKFKAAIQSDLIDKEYREAPQTITIEEGQETGGFNYVFKAYKEFKNK